jgi:glycosyltransferase involved in cell wall biosynthesis
MQSVKVEGEECEACIAPERASIGGRICMLAYTFYEADNRVRRYAETLASRGYNVEAIALKRDAEHPAVEIIRGVRVSRIQYRAVNEKTRLEHLLRLLQFFFRSMLVLARRHLEHPYDLIHVHSIPDFEVFAAWLPKLLGAKLILDIHDLVPEFHATKFNGSRTSLTFRMLVLVERISAAFCDHVIIANHVWQRRLESRSVDKKKLTTVMNYPDEKIFRRRGLRRSDNRVILLYPGSLNHHQGLDLAIRAFSRIASQAPQAEFHIYGLGQQLEYLKSLIVELRLEKQVQYKGDRPLDQIASVMETADIGIVPKRKEGFGNEAFSTKILEFMTMGIPVLVPDTLIDQYYFDNCVVEFFRGGDEQSLAAKMKLLIEDIARRQELSQNASHFVKKFLWSSNEGAYLRLIESLLDRGEPSRELSAGVSGSEMRS